MAKADKNFEIKIKTVLESTVLGTPISQILEETKYNATQLDKASRDFKSKVKGVKGAEKGVDDFFSMFNSKGGLVGSLRQLGIKIAGLIGAIKILKNSITYLYNKGKEDQNFLYQYVRRGMTKRTALDFLRSQEAIFDISGFNAKKFAQKISLNYDVTDELDQQKILDITNAFAQLSNVVDGIDANSIAEKLVELQKVQKLNEKDLINLADYLQKANLLTGKGVEEFLDLYASIEKTNLKGVSMERTFSDLINLSKSIGFENVSELYSDLNSFLSSSQGKVLLGALSKKGSPNYTAAQFYKESGGVLNAVQKIISVIDSTDPETQKRLRDIAGSKDILIAFDRIFLRKTLDLISSSKFENITFEDVKKMSVESLEVQSIKTLEQTAEKIKRNVASDIYGDYEEDEKSIFETDKMFENRLNRKKILESEVLEGLQKIIESPNLDDYKKSKSLNNMNWNNNFYIDGNISDKSTLETASYNLKNQVFKSVKMV